MTYDPFARGSDPVGVRTEVWADPGRGRTLPVEIWYPADLAHAGQDLDPSTRDTFTPGWVADGHATADDLVPQAAVRDAVPAAGRPPAALVLLVHGWAGYRREATFVGTHLASHGYVVVSPDIPLSTFGDVDAFLRRQERTADPRALIQHVRDIAAARRGDLPFLIDTASARLPVRPDGVGITGASFGGWHSLVAPALDERVGATVPMCPAGGPAPTLDAADNPLADALTLPWHTDAPLLLLAADRDSLLPLYGQLALLRAAPASDKRLVVLADADHNHFVDDIDTGQAWLAEFAERVARIYPDGPGDWPLIARSVAPIGELAPGAVAQEAWRGLVTAHFDAHLRGVDAARALLDGDLDAVLAQRSARTYTLRLRTGHAKTAP